jgi:hypothetical protein
MIGTLPSCHSPSKNVHVFDQAIDDATFHLREFHSPSGLNIPAG